MFDLGLLELDVKASVEACSGTSRSRSRRAAALLDPGRRPGRPRGLEREFATSTSATSPSSSRCSITGRSARSSPSCRSTGSTRSPTLAGHAGRHHLRLRRQGQQVHRPQRGLARHAAAPSHRQGPVLPRRLPDGRLPGHHGRPPQPLRPRERGPRLPRYGRGVRLLPRGDDRGEHDRRGAPA